MVYGILSTIAFVLILPFWLVLGIFKPKLVCGFKEKCGLFSFSNKKNAKTVLFYGVSVGEVLAMENLIKKTREMFSDINIVVMTGTQTGQEIAHKKLSQMADFITYFPFDFPYCVNNMFNKINPDAVFIMETELWPNFAQIANKRQIPFHIINARISDRTFNSYKKLKFIFAPILKKYTSVFPQSEQDCQKFLALGAKPETTKVMGNLKFDIKKPDISGLRFEKKGKILIAGSTHVGEDEIVLEVFKKLKKDLSAENSDLKLIIASRHPERNEKVFELIEKTGFMASKRSQDGNLIQNDILLLDTMGELGKFYSQCDVAFIGGSFTKKCKGVGGHNPLEATIFNKPVISGPSIHNFKDIYAILTSSDAGVVVKTEEEFYLSAKKLLTDEDFYKKASQDCEKVFAQNQGALGFVIDVLQKLV